MAWSPWLNREPSRSQANYFLTAAACSCGWTTSPRRTEASPICCLSSPSFLRWRVSALSPLLFFNVFSPFVSSLVFLCALAVFVWSGFTGVDFADGQRSDYAVRYVASMPSPQEYSAVRTTCS